MQTISFEQFTPLFKKLTKTEIGGFLELNSQEILSHKKSELVKKMIEVISSNEKMTQRFFNTFHTSLSLSPSEVENLLSITKTERARWTKEGKLKVVAFGSFMKFGKLITFPKYDGYHTRVLTQNEINLWRTEQKKRTAEARKDKVLVAQETEPTKKETQYTFYESQLKPLLTSYEKANPLLGATLNLSYWTWMAEQQKKPKSQYAQQTALKQKKDELDEAKFSVLRTESYKLLLASPYATPSFHRPSDADKVERMDLCKSHDNQWREIVSFPYVSKGALYKKNQTAIDACANCNVQIIKEHHSVYRLSIIEDSPVNWEFSFAIPFTDGNVYFPVITSLPVAKDQDAPSVFHLKSSQVEKNRVEVDKNELEKQLTKAISDFKIRITEQRLAQ